MFKIITIFVFFSFLLSSCGTTIEEIVTTPEKTPFFIQTYAIGKKVESYSVEKSARLTAWSSVTLAAESLGEVTSIWVKEGQKIRKWSKLISLKDTINSYDIRLAQAENALTIQDSSVESSRLSLDRAITETQIAYEQTKKSYDTLLAKNALIYDTLVNTNAKTLESYSENYRTYISGLDALMTNFLYEWDRILGITTNFEYVNDAWEPYLGIRIGNAYADAKNEWNKTYSSRWEIRAKKEKGWNLSISTIQSDLDIMTNGYIRLQMYVDATILMIQNNVVWGGLPQSMQDGWVVLWNGIKTQIQWSESAFNVWKSQTLTFFNNYQNIERATGLAIASLTRELSVDETSFLSGSQDARLTYESTRVDLRDKIKTLELSLKQAQASKDNAIKNKALTLNQLAANRNSSSLSLDQAKREYAKLAIIAPFDGTVTKVITSVGQRTSIWAPLIEVATNIPEIVIDVDSDVAKNVSNGNLVIVKMDEKIFTGTITALSRTAWANLLYTMRISVPTALWNIWSAVNVIFPLLKETISPTAWEWVVLPLKSIKIISEQEWEIAIFSQGKTLWNKWERPVIIEDTISYKSVKLGKVVWEGIEIIDRLDPASEIILTDISNYDPLKYILIKKN